MTSTIDTERSEQNGRGREADGPTQIPLQGWKDILWRLYNEVSDDRIMLVAAGVTYYILLAFVPGLSAFISIYGLFLDPSTVTGHLSMLQGIIPGGAMDILQEQLTRLAERGNTSLSLTLLISLGLALWSANAGMKALFEAMNVAYDEKESRGFIKLTAVSLLFTLGAMAMIMAIIVVVIGLPAVFAFIGLGTGTEWLIQILSYAALFVLLSLAIAALYRWAPNRSQAKWRWITPGGALGLIGTLIISVLFTWYTSNFGSYDATYGSLGAIIGFMTWMWISLVLLILGGELNSELEHQTAMDTTTGVEQPMGERGARMADSVGRNWGEAARPSKNAMFPGEQKGAPPPPPERRKISLGTLAVTVPAALILSYAQKRAKRRS
ncbi:YihY/virulence factor BrkB family protein [Consotaella salsifontis]|uniref:Membrane protein n=1 Tax=Consotaella salsifontis TaxID=1365950 RepID=A0A1T4MN48_9HYPH|nr:YihY/virulence factor BrkB family protein [Consotaella salsifontis]SJZ68373.1 membrane protein [Consotaella salsifontis]